MVVGLALDLGFPLALSLCGQRSGPRKSCWQNIRAPGLHGIEKIKVEKTGWVYTSSVSIYFFSLRPRGETNSTMHFLLPPPARRKKAHTFIHTCAHSSTKARIENFLQTLKTSETERHTVVAKIQTDFRYAIKMGAMRAYSSLSGEAKAKGHPDEGRWSTKMGRKRERERGSME